MADKAREKALKKLAAKPPVDPEVDAKRREARLARDAAAAEKRGDKKTDAIPTEREILGAAKSFEDKKFIE